MTPRCDSCAYWRLSDDPSESDDQWDADDKQGECRRHAPYPLEVSDESPIVVWPLVTGSDWCGEFKLRSEAGDE